MTNTGDEFEKQRSKFEEYTNKVNTEIKNAVHKAFIQLKTDAYKKKMLNKDGTKGENIETADTMKAILSLKAEKRDIEKLNNLKANKTETEDLQDIIVTFNKQLSHLTMLFNESLKMNLIRGVEPR
jgi:hypothetical protein